VGHQLDLCLIAIMATFGWEKHSATTANSPGGKAGSPKAANRQNIPIPETAPMTADHHAAASRRRALGATLVYHPITLELVAAGRRARREPGAKPDQTTSCACTKSSLGFLRAIAQIWQFSIPGAEPLHLRRRALNRHRSAWTWRLPGHRSHSRSVAAGTGAGPGCRRPLGDGVLHAGRPG
jgi:hypothetical protein